MAEVLLDGRGSGYLAGVTDTNRLMVDSNVSVSTGSEFYIKGGSVQTYNPQGVGSVHVVNPSSASITGSIEVFTSTGSVNIYGAISITAGSESWIKTGSISLLNSLGSSQIFGTVGISTSPLPISGIVNIGTGSLAISNFAALGSTVVIDSPETIGSLAVQTISGVITIDNRVAGSIVNLPIGSNFTLSSPGSIGVFSTLLPVSGIVNLGNAWAGTGSVYVVNPSSASITGSIEVFSSTGSVNVYGTLGVSGIVNQGTTPWVVSGIVNLGSTWAGTGSVFITQGQLSTIGSFTAGKAISGVVNIGVGSVSISNFAALGSKVVLVSGGLVGLAAHDQNSYGAQFQQYTGLSTTVQTVTNGVTTFYGYYVYNPNTTAAYVQLFSGTSITLGTTRPNLVLGIPPDSAANMNFPVPLNFPSNLRAAATTTASGNGALTVGLPIGFFFQFVAP